MTKFLKILSCFFVFAFLAACSNNVAEADNTKEPVVKVFDQYLYSSDITGIIPQGASITDSINIAQTYINNWIQDQIMLHYADDYLTNQLDEIDQKTTDFKNSLLIHKFKEELVNFNADSIVTTEQISKYYNTHQNEFKLSGAIIKGFLVMIPINAADLNNFKNLLKQSDENDIDEILSFCNSSSGFFEDFTHNWSDFSEKIMKIPYAVTDENYFLNTNKYAETTDDNFFYFLYISNYVSKSEIAPLEYVSTNIKQIIIQTQTNNIINQFKQEKYDEAVQQGDIIFYN
ncbi:MAG: hypothetical protein JXR68_12695 [Bacteroidales bacterium]|nr:hypothetical protein [Bacteroidales bacterium]